MTDMDKMAAILHATCKEQYHILEVEAIAKTLGSQVSFDLVGPKGRFRCTFRDAHYSIFDRVGGGSVAVKAFQHVTDIHCENLGDLV